MDRPMGSPMGCLTGYPMGPSSSNDTGKIINEKDIKKEENNIFKEQEFLLCMSPTVLIFRR